MRKRTAAILAVAGLALAIAGAVREWRTPLTSDRSVITATPSLAGLFQRTDVTVRAGERACIAPVPFEATTERAILTIDTRQANVPQRLRVEARAGGYRSATTARAATPGSAVPVIAALRPPAQRVTGSLCVRNLGRRSMALVGTTEPRSQSVAVTTVEGEPQPADVALTLAEAEPRAPLSRLDEIFSRASTMTSGLMPVWLLWSVCALLAVAAPLALFWSVYAALRAEP